MPSVPSLFSLFFSADSVASTPSLSSASAALSDQTPTTSAPPSPLSSFALVDHEVEHEAKSDGEERVFEREADDEDYVLLDRLKEAAKLSLSLSLSLPGKDEVDEKDLATCATAEKQAELAEEKYSFAQPFDVDEFASLGVEAKEENDGSAASDSAQSMLGFSWRPVVNAEEESYSEYLTDDEDYGEVDQPLGSYCVPKGLRGFYMRAARAEDEYFNYRNNRCWERRLDDKTAGAMTQAVGKNATNLPKLNLPVRQRIAVNTVQHVNGNVWPKNNQLDAAENEVPTNNATALGNSMRSPFGGSGRKGHRKRKSKRAEQEKRKVDSEKSDDDDEDRNLKSRIPRTKPANVPGLTTASTARWAAVLADRQAKKRARQAYVAARVANSALRAATTKSSALRKFRVKSARGAAAATSVPAAFAAAPVAKPIVVPKKASTDFMGRCGEFSSFRRAFYDLYQSQIHSALTPARGTRIAEIRFAPVAQDVRLRFLRALHMCGLEPKLSFHGSHMENMQKILDMGLLIGGSRGVVIANGDAYGRGIYSSRAAGGSLSYARATSTMFICAYLPVPSEVDEFGSVVVCKREQNIVPLFLLDFESLQHREPNDCMVVRKLSKGQFLTESIQTTKRRQKGRRWAKAEKDADDIDRYVDADLSPFEFDDDEDH